MLAEIYVRNIRNLRNLDLEGGWSGLAQFLQELSEVKAQYRPTLTR